MDLESLKSSKGASSLRVAWVYDMNACLSPTGVTRHALGQLDRLAERPDVDLTVISGRISEPDGLAAWERLDGLNRRELPLSTRNALRFWRVAGRPPLEWWSGAVDWAYCPAELFVPTRKARRAVTSHDVLQDVRFGGPRRQAVLDRAFGGADLVLSVSKFNTEKLLAMFPDCRGKVALVPNAAEEIFFGESTPRERSSIRVDLKLPPGLPYLLSVASFQARKNLVRLVRAAGRIREVVQGELGLVLLGAGAESEARPIREAVAEIGPKAVIRMPGYRQGRPLLAAYAEASALVFPSTCESFGIPAVEAMAQGVPVALADSTALPEIGGEAGWYFDPLNEEAIAGALRGLLDRGEERARKVEIGRSIVENYRWRAANDRLIAAFQGHRDG
ncbi:glycosyltransferase family 4 protein [Tundrisphaera lichenicola]|uniref:glycosyltransferase family 4 protein n=1 Tax=Tundrisphaera lichenicola TaxID=2029860 RepID=UPI003EBDDF6D